MFDVDSMISDRTKSTTISLEDTQAASSTSSSALDVSTSNHVDMQACSAASSSTLNGSTLAEVGVPTLPDSSYNFSEIETRVRSQSLPGSKSLRMHGVWEQEKSMMITLTSNQTNYAHHKVLDW